MQLFFYFLCVHQSAFVFCIHHIISSKICSLYIQSFFGASIGIYVLSEIKYMLGLLYCLIKKLFQVFDISSLQIFSPRELDYLICGRRELWEVRFFLSSIAYTLIPNLYHFWECINNHYMLQAEKLVDHIKFDHGYTAKSPVIANVCANFKTAFCTFFVNQYFWVSYVLSAAWDHGRIHTGAAACFLPICDRCSEAPTWWSGCIEP